MKIVKFEDIVAWQKSKELTLITYKVFNTCKDYGFRDQIQRACVSIMNNIAEGFERNSDKELKQFFYIAKGSCGEVRSMMLLAKELNYVSEKEFIHIYDLSLESSRLLSGFIKKLS